MNEPITLQSRNTDTITSWSCYLIFALMLTVVVFSGCRKIDVIMRPDQSGARFAIAGNYLYAITGYDWNELQILDITTVSNPVAVNSQDIGFCKKTISSYNQYLFIGSQYGMNIYDNFNPQFPIKVSSLLQAGGCDPVVVEGNYAYVAIGSGTAQCTNAGTTGNELDAIDISTISAPVLVKSYPLQGSSAIGVDSGKLFVCDGLDGLKVFDVTDPANIALIQQIAGQICYDLIPGNNHLVVSGWDGLYQYDYSIFPMVELSKL